MLAEILPASTEAMSLVAQQQSETMRRRETSKRDRVVRQDGRGELNREIVAQTLQVCGKIRRLPQRKTPDGAHRGAQHAARIGIGTVATQQQAVDAESGTGANDRPEILRV